MDDIDRECIECDGGCGKSDPKSKCARCHTTYYCSKKCQSKHWKAEHRNECYAVEDMRQRGAATQETSLATMRSIEQTIENSINKDCPICLDAIKDPVVLDCKHGSCFQCMRDYQNINNRAGNHDVCCPLCRRQPNANDVALSRVTVKASRAAGLEKGDERDALVQSSLEMLSTFLDDNPEDLRLLFLKAELLLMQGDSERALAILNNLMNLSDQGETHAAWVNERLDIVRELRETDQDDQAEQILEELETYMKTHSVARVKDSGLDVKFFIAEAHETSKDYEAAAAVYKSMFMMMEDASDATAVQQRKLFMGISRCFYEIGDFDKAIAAGGAALEMNRHFPGAYKYVALAHKEMGNLEMAQTTMNRAVLYETPWDDQNRQEAYNLWEKLISE